MWIKGGHRKYSALVIVSLIFTNALINIDLFVKNPLINFFKFWPLAQLTNLLTIKRGFKKRLVCLSYKLKSLLILEIVLQIVLQKQ